MSYSDITIALKSTNIASPVIALINTFVAQDAEASDPTLGMCGTKCYDARTDNKEITYVHSNNTILPVNDSIAIRKGISLHGYVFAEQTGCIVSGANFNVCMDGNRMTVSFVHPTAGMQSVSAGLPLFRWASFSISVNPNFMTIFIRNRSDGIITKNAIDFKYKPIDNDDPGYIPYAVDFTLGNLQNGMYYIHFDKPFATGVKPFCAEQTGLCDFSYTSVILDPYSTESGRYNLSLSHFDNNNSYTGIGMCDWYDDAAGYYRCVNNKSGLLENLWGDLSDGVLGGSFYANPTSINGVIVYDRFGILQYKTLSGITEKYGIEFNGQDFTWKSLGVTRPSFSVVLDKLNLGAEALQPISIDSSRTDNFKSYTFSDKWLWSAKGFLADIPCPNGSFALSDGCWQQKSLCYNNAVELYPSHQRECYQWSGWDHCINNAETPINNQCWNYLTPANLCPSDGRVYNTVKAIDGFAGCKTIATPNTPYPYCPSGYTYTGKTLLDGSCIKILGDICPSGYSYDGNNCVREIVTTKSCNVTNTNTTQIYSCNDLSEKAFCNTVTNTSQCVSKPISVIQNGACNVSDVMWANIATTQGYYCKKVAEQKDCPKNYTIQEGKCVINSTITQPFSISSQGSCVIQDGTTVNGILHHNGSCDPIQPYKFTESYNIAGKSCTGDYASVTVDDCSCSRPGAIPPDTCSVSYKCAQDSFCPQPPDGCTYYENACSGLSIWNNIQACSYKCPSTGMVCPLGDSIACDAFNNCSADKYSCPLGQFPCTTLNNSTTCQNSKFECPVKGFPCDPATNQCTVQSINTLFTCPSPSFPCDSNGACKIINTETIPTNCPNLPQHPDTGTNKCIEETPILCPSGTYVPAVKNCVSCPSGTLDMATGLCIVDKCPQGVNDWTCRTEKTATCQNGQWLNPLTGDCIQSVPPSPCQPIGNTQGALDTTVQPPVCRYSYPDTITNVQQPSSTACCSPCNCPPTPCDTTINPQCTPTLNPPSTTCCQNACSCPPIPTYDACAPSFTFSNGNCISSFPAQCQPGYSFGGYFNNISLNTMCNQNMGNSCTGDYSYSTVSLKCVHYAPAGCSSGVKMITPDTASTGIDNKGYSGCYTLSPNNNGNVTCPSGEISLNGSCYSYAQPACDGDNSFNLIHGAANEWGEWSGSCWKKTKDVCPSGSIMSYGSTVNGVFSTQQGCFFPSTSVEMSGITLSSPPVIAQDLCNEIEYKREGSGFKPCTPKTILNNVIIYEGSSNDMLCPIAGTSATCSQIVGEVFMCGTDKICSGCFNPDKKGEDLSPYADINAIKMYGSFVTGLASSMYFYTEVKDKLIKMHGARLPKQIEVASVKALWGLSEDIWVSDALPNECKMNASSAKCMDFKKRLVVIWENANDKNFLNVCVYDANGNAICTADMVACSNNICPLGNNYPCVNYNGGSFCSSTKCASLADITITPGGAPIPIVDTGGYKDNNKFNTQGQCLGELKIFSGKAQRCRFDYGLLNKNCCKCEGSNCTISDSSGSYLSAISTAYNIGKALYTAVQVGTYISQLAMTGTTTIQLTGTALTTANATLASYGLGSTTVSTLGVTTIASPGMLASETAPIIQAGVTDYLSAMINPTTIAISVAVMLITKLILLQCDVEDITTVAMKGNFMKPPDKNDGMCHYVGEYCDHELPFGLCWARANMYCCFNSKISRIIHEQVRNNPQINGPLLKKFEIYKKVVGWANDEKYPDCDGFTPNEFSMIDFSKVDLSEYYGENFKSTLETNAANLQNQRPSDYKGNEKSKDNKTMGEHIQNTVNTQTDYNK